MALNVVIDKAVVTGWVNKLLGDKGFELARPINQKNADGQWEVVGKNYFKVWFNEPVELNTEVDVVGRVTVKETEYEGKTRIELHVKALKVTKTVKHWESNPDPLQLKQDAPF